MTHPRLRSASLTLFAFIAALIVFTSFISTSARAERADRDQPMHIQSDSLHHDEAQQTSLFTGNVVLTKGSIILRGQELRVRQDSAGFQHAKVKAAPKKLAFFRQKRDTPAGAAPEHVEGEAEQIEYDSSNDTLRLTGRAQLRRYTKDKLSDELSGSTITYNHLSDIFTVESQPASRVRATLAPKAAPVVP